MKKKASLIALPKPTNIGKADDGQVLMSTKEIIHITGEKRHLECGHTEMQSVCNRMTNSHSHTGRQYSGQQDSDTIGTCRRQVTNTQAGNITLHVVYYTILFHNCNQATVHIFKQHSTNLDSITGEVTLLDHVVASLIKDLNSISMDSHFSLKGLMLLNLGLPHQISQQV